MNAITEKLRAALIICGVITIAAGAGVKLMKIQIVDHEVYTVDKPNIYTEEQTLHATRGEIKDVKGVAIVENKLGFNVIIQKASFPEDNRKANEVLLKIAKFLNREGYRYYDSLPVSTEAPFSFTTDDEDDLSYLKSSLGVNVYATAENCIDKFTVDYDIDESYTDEEKRIISGIRYEMKRRDFSLSNVFTLCEDIDTRRRRIKKMRFELNSIRGYKICPKCDAEVNEKFQFCGVCGARLPDMDDEDFASLETNDYYTESDSFFNADTIKNY